MRRNRLFPVLFAAILFVFGASPDPPAQTTTESAAVRPASVSVALDLETLNSRLEAARENEELDETVRTQLVDAYAEAVDQMEKAEAWREQAEQYRAAREQAPARLAAIREELAEPIETPNIEPPADASLQTLEQSLEQAESNLAAARERQTELEAARLQRVERRQTIQNESAAGRDRLAALESAGEAEPAAAPQLLEAHAALREARRAAVRAEQKAYEEELASYDARVDLLAAQTDLAERQVLEAEQRAEAWREIVNERRRQEAAQEAREARQEAAAVADAPEAIQEIARMNAQLAQQRVGPDGLTARIEETSGQLAATREKLLEIQKEFDAVRRRVQQTGLTHAMGVFVRKKQRFLPEIHQVQRNIRARQDEISDAQLQLVEAEDQAFSLAELEQRTSATLARLGPFASPEARAEMRGQIYDLLVRQRNLLEDRIADLDRWLVALLELDAAEREFVAGVEQYSDFIGERILWIRSTSPYGPADAVRAAETLGWFFSPGRWTQAARSLGTDAAHSLAPAFVALAAILLLGATRRRARAALAPLAEGVASARTDHYRYTFEALALTVWLALFYPAILFALGRRLGRSPGITEFSQALSAACLASAPALFSLTLLRQACRRGGLAEAHFRWDEDAIASLRRLAGFLACSMLPFVFLHAALQAQDSDIRRDSLGRALFIAVMAVGGVAVWRFLRPARATFRDLAGPRRPNVVARIWPFLYWALLLGFVALAVAAATGYYYTALEIGTRLRDTIWFLFALLFAQALLMRWFFVARRRVALKRVEERREARRRAAETEAETPGDALPEIEPEEELSLPKINTQTRQLVRSISLFTLILGLWFIWSQVFPALGILNDVELWDNVRTVNEEIVQPDGSVALETVERNMPVTLAKVLLAVGVVVLTFGAARNLPSVLEMLLLDRLPLDQGGRYAAATLVKYFLTGVGFVVAFMTLGVGWQKVQWLAAAMTVGLGFGLQEIFANFISGLIILTERPIRVGDVVTLGDVTGIVTRIRIRATTIADWDRKELIVPNKEFITGQLINWSLSDPIIRVVVPVGIAYGSDIEKAERLMLEAANEHPNVLKDPEPSVLFRLFGDNSLNFDVRVFVPDINHYLSTLSSMNKAIDRKFRAEKIEIAFPQRDIHIRSIKASLPVEDMRVRPDEDQT